MYESPIDLIQNEMEIYVEGEILKAVQKVGVNVDKEELLRALAYDREQYNKGYRDGVQGVCMRILERLEEKLSFYRNADSVNEVAMGMIFGVEVASEIVKEEM